MENQRKFSHFQEPLKLIQVTERRLPVHLIGSVKDERLGIKTEGIIKKLKNCSEDRFVIYCHNFFFKIHLYQAKIRFKTHKQTN